MCLYLARAHFCTTPPYSAMQLVNEFGIVYGHAYGILQVVEETDASGTHRLLQVGKMLF